MRLPLPVVIATMLLAFFSHESLAQSTSVASRADLLQWLREHDDVLPPRIAGAPYTSLSNPEAVVPPQCYTRHETRFNPCYVCHQDAIPGRENVMNDGDLQRSYQFSDVGTTNHWRNLFIDRSTAVAAITDAQVLDYIAQDNYSELPARLRQAGFKGWIPDLADLQLARAAFDEHGMAKDGSHWVAFNYKPFPSTFWPTNGSTDDVMLRLPAEYRRDAEGRDSLDVYRANLGVLEASMKGMTSISILPVDEAKLSQDLDGDGQIGQANKLAVVSHWFGGARDLPLQQHIYPAGTEFLHTVRYLGLSEDGVTLSTRMKEVRYMRKVKAFSKAMHARSYAVEAHEKEAGSLPYYADLGDYGLDNGNGWAVQGFIEGRAGKLRALTFEENLSCMGCHNAVGSTIDKTFSFPRKVDGAAGWRYIDLRGMKDAPNQGEQRGEIALYLERTGGGSEFRSNDEMEQRWFSADGSVNQARVAAAKDVYELIAPSNQRALMLNKAYWCLVREQSYLQGKDATVTPPKNVYELIENGKTPTLPEDKTYRFNILLDWSGAR